jgi:hypothetical protein
MQPWGELLGRGLSLKRGINRGNTVLPEVNVAMVYDEYPCKVCDQFEQMDRKYVRGKIFVASAIVAIDNQGQVQDESDHQDSQHVQQQFIWKFACKHGFAMAIRLTNFTAEKNIVAITVGEH